MRRRRSSAVARELAIDVDQPESINDDAAYDRIAAAAPDAVVVCAFGALIGERLLEGFAPLNVHPSLLPRWRGAAPIERAIMAGDRETGVGIMRLEAGLDTGPVCLSQADPDPRRRHVRHARAAARGAGRSTVGAGAGRAAAVRASIRRTA